MTKTHSLLVECLMDDEESQIRGWVGTFRFLMLRSISSDTAMLLLNFFFDRYTYVNDESGLSMSHISLWSLSDIRSLMKCIQNSTPMRHKSTHFINIPHYANKVFEFFLGLLNDKLKGRVIVSVLLTNWLIRFRLTKTHLSYLAPHLWY